jgi:tetratricopeptide (TPR) repeat protein
MKRHSLSLLAFAFALLALVSVAQGQSTAELQRSQELFGAGNQLLSKGDHAQAIAKYTEAIGLTPNEPLPYINRGVAQLLIGKPDAAQQDADKAISIMETSLQPVKYKAIAYEVKGMAVQSLGNNQLAIELFSKSIELDAANTKAYINRGNSYRLLKQYEPALKDFDKAIELDATLPHAYVNRGSVHLSLKNLTAAMQDFDEAIRLSPNQELAYYNRANLHAVLKKYDLAIADYDKAIALKRRTEFLNARGKLFFTLGKYDQTVKDNTDALAIDPKNPHALGDRAVANSRLGKDALAIDDIRKAIELKGASPTLRYSLAYFLYKSGQFAPAAEEVSKVIALSPEWQAPYRLRANCYIKLGNQVKAKADRLAAEKLSPASRPNEGELVISIDLMTVEDISQ